MLWAEEGSRGEEEETHAKVAIFIFLLGQLQLPTNRQNLEALGKEQAQGWVWGTPSGLQGPELT